MILRVLIFHALFELAGGAEKFTLELSRALESLGHDVEIYTFSRDRSVLERSFNLLSPNYRPKVSAIPTPLVYNLLDSISGDRFVRLKRLILSRKFLKDVVEDKDHLVIDTYTNIPTNSDITYIHYPTVDPGYSGGLVYNMYHTLVKLYTNFLAGNSRLVLTNSSWTAEKVLNYYPNLKDKIYVLNPPVDVEFFNQVANNDVRDDLIITVSRFTPEKGLDRILRVAKVLKRYKFMLIGSMAKYSEPVITSLKTIIKSEGLDNVELRTNIPRAELLESLGRAKYYLHPPFPEHFGISVVEAMAAGCVPIVYRDGGAWVDIVSKVDGTLGYKNIDEVPKIINQVNNSLEELRNKAIHVASKFNFSNFKSNVKYYLEMLSNITSRFKPTT